MKIDHKTSNTIFRETSKDDDDVSSLCNGEVDVESVSDSNCVGNNDAMREEESEGVNVVAKRSNKHI